MARFLLNVFRKTGNEKVLEKGRDCYDKGQLLDYQIEKIEENEQSMFEIKGKVKGNGTGYTPSIKFDKDELIDCSCDCIYFELNKSICKHIVALALEGNAFLEELEAEEERETVEYFQSKEIKRNRLFLEVDLWLTTEIEKDELPIDMDIEISAYGKKYKLNSKISEFLESYEKKPMRFGTRFTYDPKKDCFHGWEKEFFNYLKEVYESNLHEVFSVKKIFKRRSSGETLLKILEKNERMDIQVEKPKNFIKINLEYYNEKINISIPDFVRYMILGNSYVGYRDIVSTKIYKSSPEELEELRKFTKLMKEKDWKLSIKKEYFKDVMNKISKFTEINLDKKLREKIYEPKMVETAIFIDLYENKEISLSIKKLYDGKEEEDIGKFIIGSKEIDKKIIAEVLENYNFLKIDQRYILNNSEEIYHFLKEGIASLNEKYKILYSKNFKIRKYENLSYRASAKMTDLFEINFEVNGITKGEVYEVLRSIKEKKKYYILKNGEILLLGENKNMEELSNLLDKSGAKRSEIIAGKIRREKEYGYFLTSFLKSLKNAEISEDLEKIYEKIIKQKEKNMSPYVKGNFPILREYQKTGVQWLLALREIGMGGILADDMGLGKTLQIISYFSAIKEKKGIKLIIVPKTLMFNWRSEFEKFAPELQVNIVTGKNTKRKEIIENAGPEDILISTYGFLTRDEAIYRDIVIDTMVIDEAQNIKNYLSKVSNSVKKIKADIRIALTGTPIENNTSELWSIFDFVFPGYLGKHEKFLKKYSEDLKSLKETITPFVMRRLKSEVLSELPDKIETDIIVELGNEEKKVYLAYLARYKEEVRDDNNLEIFTYLMRLRQLCNHPKLFLENYNGKSSKLEALLELLRECKSGEHRVLLFSQFTEMLKIIKSKIPKDISCLYLDGKTTPEERFNLANRFNSGEGDVFIISLKAGGSGLNLTGADTVIHFDPWWNSSVENQATDRAYRIGQNKNVNVFKMIAKGTIEEKINIIKEGKESLIREVLGKNLEEGISMKKKDILELLDLK